MRVLTLIAVCAAAFAVTASAAQVNPKALVLQQRDAPAGFQLDRTKSGLLTNAEVRDPSDPTFEARAGRTTGYFVQYVQRGTGSGVQSQVDLFRKPGGARMLLERVHASWLKLANGDPWGRARIGTEGWYFGGDVDSAVYWRYGRAVGFVLGIGMSRQQTLALARLQQRRIAAALR
jgi:opacity protein-like surface antigen